MNIKVLPLSFIFAKGKSWCAVESYSIILADFLCGWVPLTQTLSSLPFSQKLTVLEVEELKEISSSVSTSFPFLIKRPSSMLEREMGTCHYQWELSFTSTVDLTLASSVLDATMLPWALLTISPERAMSEGTVVGYGADEERLMCMGCDRLWVCWWAVRQPSWRL